MGGHVNRALLESYYQNPGDTYEDNMTEGAMEVIAQQVDDNWDDHEAHRTAAEIDHPDGSVTGRKIRNGTLTADKFVPGALNNETQNGLRITSHEGKKVTDSGGAHGLTIEYGTFLPILRGADVEGEHTYVFRWGEYYRIGRLVSFMLGFRLSSKDPTMSGNAQIHGLPFVRGGAADNFESTSSTYANIGISAPFQEIGGLVISQSSHINIVKMGHGTNMTEVSSSEITNSTEVRFAGKYLTN